MLIVRAPVRITFGGGGTDVTDYYTHFGGFVVSASISRYCYVVLNQRSDDSIRISSADYHTWETLSRSQKITIAPPLALPKAVMSWFMEREGLVTSIDLFMASEVAPGTGLGSSSAMDVALIHAFATLIGRSMKHQEIAELACYMEIERLQMPIGKQDQYASAMGGINAIEFSAQGVQVTPLQLPEDIVSALNARLLLFATGKEHNSSEILGSQLADMQHQSKIIDALHHMKALAYEMRDALVAGELDQFGRLLDRIWQEKRGLSTKISSTSIDQYYAAALDAGALGGKINGAGGGGFLMLYCPLESQDAVRKAMSSFGLHQMSFDFDFVGSAVTVHTAHFAEHAADL